ncbi:MAG: hypothetical protein ABS46_18845 [Cytophagaceae bacterium SCN 52-12]|nr:MAG: hypothetical protein ABS46_18845 [Cytophagaceae bacterium SCN 52-12]
MAEFYSLEDFLENDRFQEWVKSPDAENSAYWKEWLEENPSRRPVFESAVAAMALLEGNQPELSDGYIRQKVAAIKENMGEPAAAGRPFIRRRALFIRWAAALVIAAGLGWLVVKHEASSPGNTVSLSGSEAAEQRESFTNNGNQPLLINLPDGSSVVLSSGSRIDYEFADGSFRRKVRLTGEGFFEVVKDPANPFYVYTAHLVTRVLGTSFLVRSFDNEPKATVTVRTGTVSVTSRRNEGSQGGSGEETLLLKPNELVSLVVATDEMIRGKWGRQQENPLPEPLQQPKYEFQLTPVTDVFTLLEKAYGVSIQYDAEKLKNCTLTATLSDEPFLDKIRMICIGIEADFAMNGNQVVITGSGCGTPDK